jgi:hypothetical protein
VQWLLQVKHLHAAAMVMAVQKGREWVVAHVLKPVHLPRHPVLPDHSVEMVLF